LSEFDRHIAKHLNKAVDNVHLQEHDDLMVHGDNTLKNIRQLWLFNPMNFCVEQVTEFEALKYSGLNFLFLLYGGLGPWRTGCVV